MKVMQLQFQAVSKTLKDKHFSDLENTALKFMHFQGFQYTRTNHARETVIIATDCRILLCLPELRIRVQSAVPFFWQLAAIDPIREFAPFQTGITLRPVLIWPLPKDTDRGKYQSM